ncbi:methyl-accepting chemotaxis protein [Anaerobacillus isosaccharinicus]|uniref:Globin-coupled sensor protein n=1 Tax=Anaerobacillus isosaccharinicus TaxID=1532552 RepID=A0A1S2MCW2_9BACI|nr:globin-coupled sensor protein [Anaerobacillus isosaccharinicus]MBA5587787.1 globin-coupled sensor protein [Anaerobacillus isosaccharinicus]QOY34056.1 globin-coupled sensor protein [Anaerobacillus isosaccharinicus]
MFFTKKFNVEKKVRPFTDSDIQSTERMKQKLSYLQLNNGDLENIKKVDYIIDKFSEDITTRHYEMVEKYANLQGIVDQYSTKERLSKTFVQYLKSIPRSKIDQEFIAGRVKIGDIHSKIRLTPEFYTGSYIRVYEYLIPGIISEYGGQPEQLSDILLSFIKFITLDSQIVLESYQEGNDFKVVSNISSVMELITKINKMKELLAVVDETIMEAEAVAAAAQQLSSSVEEVANNAINVSENAEETIRQANNGQKVIEESLNGFLSMTDDFKDTKDKITSLLQEIQNVTTVVSFIRDVSEQTNLLALNASIEAARAGEHGKGFAVVANEVRKLSEQTNTSVQKITSTIEKIQLEAKVVDQNSDRMATQLEERVDKTRDAINVLDQIITRIEDVGGATSNIAAIAEEQSAATQDITSRINEVLNHVDEIKNVTVETGSTIYDASYKVNELRKEVLKSIPRLSGENLLRVMKTEYETWKWWIYNSMIELHDLQSGDIANLQDSRLATWFNMIKNDKMINSQPTFQTMEKLHNDCFKLAKDALENVRNGRLLQVSSIVDQLDSKIATIHECLDELSMGVGEKKTGKRYHQS